MTQTGLHAQAAAFGRTPRRAGGFICTRLFLQRQAACAAMLIGLPK